MSQDDFDRGAEIPSNTPEGMQQPTAAERFRNATQSIRDQQDDPEDDLWEGGFSGKALIGWWIGSAVATVAAIILAIMFPIVSWPIALGVIVLAWLIPAAYWAYMKLAVHYRLTSQRFFHERGILSRTTDRIEVIDIDDVQYTQNIFERIVNVGKLRIKSSDASHPLVGVGRH